jgi:DNA-binding MarR family transcriptional regulator
MWRDFDHDPRSQESGRPAVGRTGQSDPQGAAAETADPRDVFVRDLELPRGLDRERVYMGDRAIELRGSEVRTLATVGAFRVIPEADLRDADTRPRDLRHLRDVGLVDTSPYVVGKARTHLVTLTPRGREFLEQARRPRDPEAAQRFYAGVNKPRELSHDAQLYRAYRRAAERLIDRGARIRRVVLEEDLKRAYQRFLQASNRRRRDSEGRPDRSADEIAHWARTQQLPMDGDHVQFPDLRIEYEERDGRRVIENVEVTTPHYRGAHAAAKARSGFTRYRATGARLGGGSSSGRSGGRGFDPRLAEEILE